MAQSNVSAWIPALWAREALRHLKANLKLALLINRDYDSEVSQAGNIINVPLPPTLVAQEKTAGNPFNAVAVTANTTPVALNRHIVAPFQVDDIAAMQARPDVVENYGRGAAIAIAEAIESALLAQYVNAATSVGTIGTNLVKGNILTARTRLSDAKVPVSESRFAIISTKDTENILADLSTSNAGSLNADRTPLRDGSVGRLYGFDVYESQLAPVVAGSPAATHGIAGHRDGIVLVTRPLTPPPADAGVASSVVTDADIGITMRVMMSYNHSLMQQTISYDVLFGVATVRANHLVNLRS